MREVLFAGKTYNGNWVEGQFVKEENYGGECVYNIMTSVTCFIYDDYSHEEVDEDTISEFTGRFDTKENRIFENDIVEEIGGHRSVVKYSEEEAKFVLESKYAVTELGNKQVTVIGNIFDNPDLIDNA